LVLCRRKLLDVEEKCVMRIFIICVLGQTLLGFVGHVAYMGEMRNTFKILVRKREGKTIHGRHKHEWEDTVKMNFQKIEQEGDWLGEWIKCCVFTISFQLQILG
jgi:hypothetical protein